MKATVEAVRKDVEQLKGKVAEARKTSKNPKADPALRSILKKLKRAQRKLAGAAPPPPETKHKSLQKRLDRIGVILGELTKAKKSSGDANVRSLRKKSRSVTRQMRRVNKIIEKQKKASAPKETAPAAAAEPAKA